MIQTLKAVFTCFLLITPLLLLSACQTGGGYSRTPSGTTPPAQQPPRALGTPSSDELLGSNATPNTQFKNTAPVKVGILLPLSGQNKKLGDAMLKAAQIALFDIGHANFELIPRDTKGTAEGARNAAQSAIDNGAQLILGPVFASSVRAAKPIAAKARINMIAFSTDWTLAGGNTYIMGFLPFDQVERVTQFAAARGIARVGLLTPETNYGRIVTETFRNAAGRNNITITQNMTFPASTTNLAPVVQSFTRFDERKARGALAQTPFDAVLMPVGNQEARAIGSLLTLYELPPRSVRRLGTGLMDEASLASEKNLEGTWFAAPPPAARKNFENRFAATYGSAPPRLASLAFDATALAAVLAKRGLSTDGKPAFDTTSIRNPNGFSGLDGIFRFRNDNTAQRGLAVLEFRRGQTVVIDEAPTTFQHPQEF
ncbi:MAG: penicillin-binding protein activator [Alphaproteobacteria bacterium]